MCNSMMLIILVGVLLLINNNIICVKQSTETLAKRFLSSTNSESLLGGVKSSLFIQGAENKSAVINLKLKNSAAFFTIGYYKKEFVIMAAKDTKILQVKADKSSTLKGETLMTNALKVDGEVKYNKLPQWKMVVHDSFHKNNTSLEWSHDKTTECEYHKILGGHCQLSKTELEKEIVDLPPH